jgi:hypothetical protein
LETCAFTAERFPEYDDWLAARADEKEEHERRIKEIDGDTRGLLIYAIEKLAGIKPADLPPARPAPPPPIPRPSLTRALAVRQPQRKERIGTNDPCPCGSAKIFKTCCGRS